jgi:spore germination cell wall hydrolase CwlJ-like protein
MPRNGTIPRSDNVLIIALAVVLATGSAAIGSALTYHPPQSAAPAIAATASAPSPADMVLAQLVKEHQCLSEALYYEARGEGPDGQKAVAEVIFHRMNTGNYGHSICAVVYDGSDRPGCQFSFTCDGAMRRPREGSAWEKAERLAAHILTGEVQLRNDTNGATHYHAAWVNPYWAPALKRTARIGNHIFYRAVAAGMAR